MDLLLGLAGLVILSISLIISTINIFRKRQSKKVIFMMLFGLVLFATGASIGIKDMKKREKAEDRMKSKDLELSTVGEQGDNDIILKDDEVIASDFGITEDQYKYIFSRYKELYNDDQIHFKISDDEDFNENLIEVGELRPSIEKFDMLNFFPIDKDIAYMYGEGINNGEFNRNIKSLRIKEFSGFNIVDGNEVYIESNGLGYLNKRDDDFVDRKLDRTLDLYTIDEKDILKVGRIKKFNTEDEEIEWYKDQKRKYPRYIVPKNKYQLYNEIEDMGTYNSSTVELMGLADIKVSGVKFKDCLVIDEGIITGFVSEDMKTESVFYSRSYLAEGIGEVYIHHNTFSMGYNTQPENQINYYNANTYFLGIGKGEWKD